MTASDEWLKVESLDLEAQGVAHNAEGKVVFIEGALPGEEVQVQRAPAQEQLGAGDASTALRRESSQRVTPAVPPLRHLRRLQDAAPARGRAGGHQAARARRRAVAPGQGEGRAAAAPDRRAGLGLPLPGAAVGAVRGEEGQGAGRLPRAQVQLRGRHGQLRGAAAAPERHAGAAARTGRRPWTSATACRRSRWRWATRSPRWCCATSSR